jgi:hypothetical protein
MMAAATFSILALPQAARAAGSDSAIAEDLFADAKRLLDAGDTAHACPKFAESLRLDPTLGTRLNLAHCYEVAGKTASAWGEYKEVVRQASASGDTTRANVAQEHVTTIESKLSRVTLRVASPEGVAFELDGNSLQAAVVGTALPIDPGDHVIEATEAGKKPFKSTFHVDDQSSSIVDIPALEDAPVVAPPPPPSGDTTRPDEHTGSNAKRTAGYIVGGAGVVALGVGVFFGIKTLSLASDVKSECPNGPCASQDGIDKNSSAHTDALVSDITLGIGVVAVAAGVYLILTSKSTNETSHAAFQITPSASPHGGGAAIVGRF